MDPTCQAKLTKLKAILQETDGCAVAYSGGVDSSLLLTVAHEVLGDRCLAVIATSSTYARQECDQAVAFAEQHGIPCVTVVSEELDIPGFRDNPPDRCYHCKKELFTKVAEQGARRGLNAVADGTNADDVHDYRPGARAADELNVLTPLKDAGLTKSDIRTIARDVYDLPMADKPAMACLASRFPYGSTITSDKLRQVEAMERFLADHGFSGFRARHHGDIIRLELRGDQLPRLLESETRQTCIQLAKELGFKYVTMDLEGYRTGSMNEVLDTAATRT